MRFKEYVEKGHLGEETLEDFALRVKVSYQTMKGVARGMRIKLYAVAQRISEGTIPEGKEKPRVTIADLCEE